MIGAPRTGNMRWQRHRPDAQGGFLPQRLTYLGEEGLGEPVSDESQEVPSPRQEQAAERQPLASDFFRVAADGLEADHADDIVVPFPARPRIDAAAHILATRKRAFSLVKAMKRNVRAVS